MDGICTDLYENTPSDKILWIRAHGGAPPPDSGDVATGAASVVTMCKHGEGVFNGVFDRFADLSKEDMAAIVCNKASSWEDMSVVVGGRQPALSQVDCEDLDKFFTVHHGSIPDISLTFCLDWYGLSGYPYGMFKAGGIVDDANKAVLIPEHHMSTEEKYRMDGKITEPELRAFFRDCAPMYIPREYEPTPGDIRELTHNDRLLEYLEHYSLDWLQQRDPEGIGLDPELLLSCTLAELTQGRAVGLLEHRRALLNIQEHLPRIPQHPRRLDPLDTDLDTYLDMYVGSPDKIERMWADLRERYAPVDISGFRPVAQPLLPSSYETEDGTVRGVVWHIETCRPIDGEESAAAANEAAAQEPHLLRESGSLLGSENCKLQRCRGPIRSVPLIPVPDWICKQAGCLRCAADQTCVSCNNAVTVRMRYHSKTIDMCFTEKEIIDTCVLTNIPGLDPVNVGDWAAYLEYGGTITPTYVSYFLDTPDGDIPMVVTQSTDLVIPQNTIGALVCSQLGVHCRGITSGLKAAIEGLILAEQPVEIVDLGGSGHEGVEVVENHHPYVEGAAMSPDSTPSNERLVNRSMGPLTPAVLAEASQRHGEAERQREALEAEHLKVHRQQVTDSLEELVGECIAPLTNLDQSRLQRFFAAEIGPLLRLLEAEDARNEDLISSCQELGGGASEPMEQTCLDCANPLIPYVRARFVELRRIQADLEDEEFHAAANRWVDDTLACIPSRNCEEIGTALVSSLGEFVRTNSARAYGDSYSNFVEYVETCIIPAVGLSKRYMAFRVRDLYNLLAAFLLRTYSKIGRGGSVSSDWGWMDEVLGDVQSSLINSIIRVVKDLREIMNLEPPDYELSLGHWVETYRMLLDQPNLKPSAFCAAKPRAKKARDYQGK